MQLIKRLTDEWMRGLWNNQALRHGGEYPPKPPAVHDQYWEIGHRSYAQAKLAWQGAVKSSAPAAPTVPAAP